MCTNNVRQIDTKITLTYKMVFAYSVAQKASINRSLEAQESKSEIKIEFSVAATYKLRGTLAERLASTTPSLALTRSPSIRLQGVNIDRHDRRMDLRGLH